MTAQAAASRAQRYVGLASYWISFVGTLALFVLLSAILFMPLGAVVFDYWTPKVQGLWQPAKGGKR